MISAELQAMPADGLNHPFPLVIVEGGPRERGLSYGRQAADRIAKGVDIYRDAFETVGMGWSEAMGYARRFSERILAFDAEMHAEIAGIAQGSDQPLEAVIALNARTEIIFWHDNVRQGGAGTPAMQEECTSIAALPAVTADGHVLHGQNWDWNPRCAGSAIVLNVRNADGPDILTFCEAGQLARHGMNSAGVALTVNGLQCEHDGGHVGTPSPLLRRRLLSMPSLAGALDVVLNGDISFSHSLTISHGEGSAVSIETTTDRSYWLQPEHGLLTHANHFKALAAQQCLIDVGLKRCPESLYRDQRVFDRLRADGTQVTLDSLKSAFADRFGAPDSVLRTPKARPGGNLSGTVATLLMDATARRMWLAPSPYMGIEFTEYGFS